MSVIKRREEIIQSPIRIGFCGSMGSGKTYASNELRNSVSDAKVLSISTPIKQIVLNMGKEGRASHIMVGMCGRHIDEDVWVKKVMKSIDETPILCPIIVDDIRFENEAVALKNAGFTLVYLNTPWAVRFKRILTRSSDLNEHVQWFGHESEVAPENIDKKHFDYICTNEEDVKSVIDTIVNW